MPRSVPIWKGKTPDTKAPPRVRLRVFDRCEGKCHRCERKVATGEKWTLEHIKALCNGGPNDETNLGVTCDNCLPVKNAEDVAEKAKVAATRQKHIGIKDPPKMTGRPFHTTRKAADRKEKASSKLDFTTRRRLYQ